MADPVAIATKECTDVYPRLCEGIPGFAFDISTKSRALWFPSHEEATAARHRWISWRATQLNAVNTSYITTELEKL